MRSRLLSGLFCFWLPFTIGCGNQSPSPQSAAAVDQSILNDVGELYRVYQVTKNKPPTKLADLAPFEQGGPIGYKALSDGAVVVFYNSTLPYTGEGLGHGGEDQVLAYLKDVPELGGAVLMMDRSIQTMTADEFKAASKAGK